MPLVSEIERRDKWFDWTGIWCDKRHFFKYKQCVYIKMLRIDARIGVYVVR